MPSVRAVHALLLLSGTASCLPRTGNDASLTPLVHRDRSGAGHFTVRAKAGTQVAAFAVRSDLDGWTLRYLGAKRDGGEISFTGQSQVTSPLPTVSGTMGSLSYGHPAACAIGLPTPPDIHGQSFPSYDWGCSQFLGDLSPRIVYPSTVVSVPHDDVSSPYLVLVVSTAPVDDARWQALADSLGTVGILAQAPGRLGQLAFARSATRWAAALEVGPLGTPVPWTKRAEK